MTHLSLGHGSGGRLSQELVSRIVGEFSGAGVATPEMEDCALLPGGIGVTIDGFTVSPRVFPGGTLGHLAVCGATNDLAVRGVRPEHLCLSVIAEEGFDEEELLSHMRDAAGTCASLDVALAAGDTKIVPRGAADGLYLAACAVGTSLRGGKEGTEALGLKYLHSGDRIILSGPPGRHGATIAACRAGLSVPGLESDCAPLWPMLESLARLRTLRCMRDCTRGGVASSLCEWAEGAGVGIVLHEKELPHDEGVESVADLLGFDVLQLACEGTVVVAVGADDADDALALLRTHPLGAKAAIVGEVTDAHPRYVGLRTCLGGTRVLDMPIGEILPRIC